MQFLISNSSVFFELTFKYDEKPSENVHFIHLVGNFHD
jgi:hypothetical protein